MPKDYETLSAGKHIVKVDPELENLIPGFMRNRVKDAGIIRDALTKNDYVTIKRLGHTMKGAGGGYGFDAIMEIGRLLEAAAGDEDTNKIKKLADQLLDYVNTVEIVFETI